MASREDALRVLGEIANFFRRTEPHSPISYTLDEAVRRGRLSWPELLQEVVADLNTRNGILNMLGIRPPPPEA
jgi:type VI secretion system protein ImpA